MAVQLPSGFTLKTFPLGFCYNLYLIRPSCVYTASRFQLFNHLIWMLIPDTKFVNFLRDTVRLRTLHRITLALALLCCVKFLELLLISGGADLYSLTDLAMSKRHTFHIKSSALLYVYLRRPSSICVLYLPERSWRFPLQLRLGLLKHIEISMKHSLNLLLLQLRLSVSSPETAVFFWQMTAVSLLQLLLLL